MEQILLQNLLPSVFASKDGLISDVWLQQVSLQRGKTCLLEAASGTGKSSLCNFIYGVRFDYTGEILFDGQSARSLNTRQWNHLRTHTLGMLFQDLALFDELTAMENVLLKNRITRYQEKSTLTSWFEQLGIGDKMNEKTGRISFGQRQRVALIRALCQPFDFLLLDEPISHLDEANGEIFGRLMLAEAKRQGAGVIVTSIGKHPAFNYDEILKL